MTRIKVLLFATLRERAGGAKSIEVDLPDGGTVRDLKVQIAPREYKDLELKNLVKFDERKYSNTLLVFYERKIVNE